jgi:hypothetical protein
LRSRLALFDGTCPFGADSLKRIFEFKQIYHLNLIRRRATRWWSEIPRTPYRKNRDAPGMRDTEEIMNTKRSLRILQILLGVVLFLYSAELVIEQLHADHHSPAFFALLILGSVEAVAAVVFLFATPIGGPRSW